MKNSPFSKDFFYAYNQVELLAINFEILPQKQKSKHNHFKCFLKINLNIGDKNDGNLKQKIIEFLL